MHQHVIRIDPDADPIKMLHALYLDTLREGRPSIALKLAYIAAIEERDEDKPKGRRYRYHGASGHDHA